MRISWATVLALCITCAACVDIDITNSTHHHHNRTHHGPVAQQDFNSNTFQYQGVAIGGWLVLEPYITPSLFLAFNESKSSNESDIPVDEYHFCQALGPEEAEKRLQQHWSTFYNESDFEKIKSYGLNMVRIPIGYWAFAKLDSDPYVRGAQDYLDQAIVWASTNGLKVWVDLHGVPGSQNGFDNSGLRDIGYPGWFNSTDNVDFTFDVLNQIYDKYGNSSNQMYVDTILGIEVVNEPLVPSLNITTLKEFYSLTYRDARETQTINNTIVFHDAFEPIGFWNDFKNATEDRDEDFRHGGRHGHRNGTRSGRGGDHGSGDGDGDDHRNGTRNGTRANHNYNILIDHHHYEVFVVPGLNQTIAQHEKSISSYAQSIHSLESGSHPAVVGEWSAALTDCVPWLNGVGLGSRYAGEAPYDNDPIGSCANINNFKKWTKDQKINTRKFIEIQLDQYGTYTNGWIFWCFKTETTIEWDFQRLVELELMPQPLSDRKYIKNGTDTAPKKGMGIELSSSMLGYALSIAMVMLLSW